MSDITLVGIDRQLLGLLQRDFPLVEQPYLALAQRLGTGEGEVLSAIARLRSEGLVRQISPVLDARRLGYQSTLVAMMVPAGQMEGAVGVIAAHPGISHGYERDHRFNLWCTLSAPAGVDINVEVENLRKTSNVETAISLPALRVFKIGAYFDFEGESPVPAVSGGTLPRVADLSRAERTVVNLAQADLPLESRPFESMACQAGMTANEFLEHCHMLVERGVMRRYGASINHRKVGFQANAMVCWAVAPEQVLAVGREIASLKEVSHCYERLTNNEWRYNIFAMVHGDTRETCEGVVEAIVEKTRIHDLVMLYSTREFKKTRIKYTV